MRKENTASLIDDAKQIEAIDNVLDFPSKLKGLRNSLRPDLVKKRRGWRTRNGTIQMVDYVEWHTVADILDQTTPDWAHEVKDIRQIGKIATVTVAITIDGITREGIGTGFAESETGIKKAEHDALKRAAVKFGVARELYKQASENRTPVVSREEFAFPSDPLAKSLSDLVTAKQLGMIRAISKEIGVAADDECKSQMNCSTDELSRSAASGFITYLQNLRQDKTSHIRRAG